MLTIGGESWFFTKMDCIGNVTCKLTFWSQLQLLLLLLWGNFALEITGIATTDQIVHDISQVSQWLSEKCQSEITHGPVFFLKCVSLKFQHLNPALPKAACQCPLKKEIWCLCRETCRIDRIYLCNIGGAFRCDLTERDGEKVQGNQLHRVTISMTKYPEI